MGQSPSARQPGADGADGPTSRLGACLFAGHVLAYPFVFAVAVAAMPWSIVAQADALENVALQMHAQGAIETWLVERLALSIPDAARFHLIMSPIVWLVLAVFVWVHVAAWRWGTTGAWKPFAVQMGIGFGLAAAAGLAGWVWIFVGA